MVFNQTMVKKNSNNRNYKKLIQQYKGKILKNVKKMSLLSFVGKWTY